MILDKFYSIYNTHISHQINNIFNEYDADWGPIKYTLDKGRNRFRSALPVISGNINKVDMLLTSIIGSISELIHTAIIMQDDIADHDVFRRGELSAWKKYGLDRTLFSCEQTIAISLAKAATSLNTQVTLSLAHAIFQVNRGQSLQVRTQLNGDCTMETLRKIHHDKTVIGRWALTCPCQIISNIQLYNILEKYAFILGEAGSVKNDLENLTLENQYDSTSLDSVNKRVTLPLSRLIKAGKLSTNQSHSLLKQSLYKSGVYTSCKADIEKSVKEAIQILDDLPQSLEKDMLINWALFHLEV